MLGVLCWLGCVFGVLGWGCGWVGWFWGGEVFGGWKGILFFWCLVVGLVVLVFKNEVWWGYLWLGFVCGVDCGVFGGVR